MLHVIRRRIVDELLLEGREVRRVDAQEIEPDVVLQRVMAVHLVVGDHHAEAELQPVAAGRIDVVRLLFDEVERLRDQVHAAELDLAGAAGLLDRAEGAEAKRVIVAPDRVNRPRRMRRQKVLHRLVAVVFGLAAAADILNELHAACARDTFAQAFLASLGD